MAMNYEERERTARKDIEIEEDGWEKRATHGSLLEAPATPHRNKPAWALKWLPEDYTHC
jgi:hypothetical protein